MFCVYIFMILFTDIFMPIKTENIPPEFSSTVNVGENNIMGDLLFNSQDSLGLIDTLELFKEPLEQNVIEEMMNDTVNSEAEVFNNANILITVPERDAIGEVGVSPPTGTIPSQEDFTGPYGFELHWMNTPHSRGGYVYSPLLKQVFIGMNNILMMEFKTIVEPDPGFYIRALMMYTCDDFVCEPVIRCASHALEDDPRQEAHARGQEQICKCADFKNVGHVMRCTLAEAEYCYDIHSERHSVRVPVRRLQAGTDFIRVPYSFSCKNSCPRGMQRKPVQIVFTLETEEGDVYGRKVLPIKICSCPKRDKDRQERDFKKAQQSQNWPQSSKRLATSSVNDSQQPPVKGIKMEESNFEDSQNEEEKPKHRRQVTVHTTITDHDPYQKVLTRISNLESSTESHHREVMNKLDRLERLFNEFVQQRQ